MILTTSIGYTAELKKETLAAWDSYLEHENQTVQQRTMRPAGFLWSDEIPGRLEEVVAGSLVAMPLGEGNPIRVPAGLIHHWMGAVFIPNATAKDVMAVTRDYEHYKDYYKPSVAEAKPISTNGNKDEYTICLVNSSVFSKSSIQGNYVSEYVRAGANRWYSVSRTTRVQEIKDFGRETERKLPLNEGSGYIWRLYSTVRLEERGGGVVVELEAIALSRDIPGRLHWLADPIIRRVSRDAIQKSLRETAQAARNHADAVDRSRIASAAGQHGHDVR